MDWIKLLIPLIAVAVWILSHLANQNQEARRPPRVPLPPPKPREPAPPRTEARPDQDQYRVEMDRKREKAPRVPKPVPRPRSKLPLPVRRPVPPLLPAPVTRTRAPVNNSRPIEASLVLDEVVLEPIVKLGQPAMPVGRPTSVPGKNLLAVLRNQESLFTAIMLKEILDVPLSKRRRGLRNR